jgi:iron complex outermembrane receptor protein
LSFSKEPGNSHIHLKEFALIQSHPVMKTIYCLSFFLLITCSLVHAQTPVTGKVLDSRGEIVVGASILEKGTTNGTLTDEQGSYTLAVQPDATLVVAFVGYATQEVKVDGRALLDITLEETSQMLREIQIVGSRNANRSVTETPVAVDIIDMSEVATASGQLDVNQLLQVVAPSFNSNRQSGADGADHIDPASIRGLGPDQTLVLINGKRRHQSSHINIFGSRGRGNSGTDLNAIPISAIERIEILRDGASAQYGSDAIAGVINIVLKSEVNVITGNINSGIRNAKAPTDDILSTKDYDGQTYQVNLNYGAPVGKQGFINMTTDFLKKRHTNRPANPDKYSVYRRQFGDAALDNFAMYFNAAVPMNDRSSFYAFGGLNYRDTDAFAYSREADEDRNVQAIYPDGFDPHITSRITDKSLSAGVKTKLNGWDVDFNNTYGINRFHYIIDGTLNASLLEKSPTRFDAGGYQLSQNTTGVNFSQYFRNTLAGVNIAFGTEYRIDNYQIFAGEEGSYRNYGIVDSVGSDGFIVPVDTLGRPGGSQGFPGFSPANELNEFRQNLGVYVDGEFNITNSLMLAAAARFENYSDFGNTLNGKLSARLGVTDKLAIRGSVSTGFRAPSLVQRFYNTTFTNAVSGELIDQLIAKNNSPITRALGIPALKQETATNASVGFTFEAGGFTATVDGYYVEIKDRIVLTGGFDDTDPEIGDDLQNLGVAFAQFFTNALDTKTTGLDAVLTYATTLGANPFRITFVGNLNKMELGKVNVSPGLEGKEENYFGAREEKFLLASAPPSKFNLSFDYKLNRASFNLRFVRYGEIVFIDYGDEEDIYTPKITTDVTIGFQVSPGLNVSVGAANIFNAYPDAQDTETETGGVWDAVQMGFSGAFYFAKLGFKF